MKYMLLTYLDEKAWLSLSPDEQRREMLLCGPHVQKLLANEKLIDGAPLHPTTTATTLRLRDGKRVITDGPFAETREQLGGYTIIEADNLDDAIDNLDPDTPLAEVRAELTPQLQEVVQARGDLSSELDCT